MPVKSPLRLARKSRGAKPDETGAGNGYADIAVVDAG